MALFPRLLPGRTLPYQMFDLAREAYEAKKATKMEKIYHRAQERAWSGKQVLPMLIEKHGKPDLPPREKEALARIFAIILWGELAAWKISAQLAEALEPLEAKMAATGQSFDEARHFYTMYDYLKEIDYVPERIDFLSEKVLDLTLRTDSLAYKVCGMQLMIETIALTIFQTVRQNEVEPVLSELLRYFEIDEARHVGLGINYLPVMIKQMSRLEVMGLMLFQFRLMMWVMLSLTVLQKDFRTLGVPARKVVELGKAKQFQVLREMWGQLGVDIGEDRPLIGRFFDGLDELLFPEDEAGPLTRLGRAVRVFFARQSDVDEAHRQEAEAQMRSDVVLPGMGEAGAKWRARRGR
jgi:hypothetical protein